MKSKSYKFILLISGIVIGLFIISNVGLSKKSVSFNLNSYEYLKAVQEKNNLYAEIENIKSENIDLKHKIQMYEGSEKDKGKREKLVEDMKNQLSDYGNISGINSVKGSGIVIKVTEKDIDINKESEYQVWMKIFHENDMARVLNEIRSTTAETISINKRRLIPTTGVTCYGAFIMFEDLTPEAGPYYIFAIGDPDEMYATLTRDDGYLKELINRGLDVEIEKRDEIIMPKANQNTQPQFMERYDAN